MAYSAKIARIIELEAEIKRMRPVYRAAILLYKYEPTNSAQIGYLPRYDRLTKACARAERTKGK